MNDIRTKVAYLHGLAEGLELDGSTAEGRVLTSMLDVLGDIADQVMDVSEAQAQLADYLEDVDQDLGALEETLYEDDDDDEEIRFIPARAMIDEEDGIELLTCPQCGETLAAGVGDVDAAIQLCCPNCGCTISEAELEYGEDDLVQQ